MMANETAKLEEQLQRWGEVLVVGDQVLKWDKPRYAAVIVGAVSTVFLFIFWADPSFLTGLSCLLLLLCVTDLLVPTLISRIFGTNQWTTEQQQRFHELCRQLVLARQALQGWICRLLELRDSRPKVYLLSAVGGLLSTAWIGYKIHNLLLTYLVVSTLLLLPGMKHHNIVGKTLGIVQREVKKVMPSKEIKKEPNIATSLERNALKSSSKGYEACGQVSSESCLVQAIMTEVFTNTARSHKLARLNSRHYMEEVRALPSALQVGNGTHPGCYDTV